MMDKIIIRKSTVKDAPSIAKIVNSHAEKGIMLPRPISKIYDNIRDYYVETRVFRRAVAINASNDYIASGIGFILYLQTRIQV